ncbi:hypothetical protein Dimus_039383 [Dionaea muscipula]
MCTCKLQKSLYELKQAPRARNPKFTSFLPQLGFVPSLADPSLFVRVDDVSHTYLLLYVDYIILSGSSDQVVKISIKQQLNLAFDMTDLGRLHYFLGLEVRYLSDGAIFLTQQQYARDVVHKAVYCSALYCCDSHIEVCQGCFGIWHYLWNKYWCFTGSCWYLESFWCSAANCYHDEYRFCASTISGSIRLFVMIGQVIQMTKSLRLGL